MHFWHLGRVSSHLWLSVNRDDMNVGVTYFDFAEFAWGWLAIDAFSLFGQYSVGM
jgi:hypothetical protein